MKKVLVYVEGQTEETFVHAIRRKCSHFDQWLSTLESLCSSA